MHSRKFCCCLPVRFGVVCTALIGLGLGGLISIVGIVQLTHGDQDADFVSGKLPWIIQVIVYGLYALFSIIGLVGAFGKKLGLINAFGSILIFHVVFSIVAGSFSLWRFFKDAPDTINSCIDGSTDEITIQACNKSMDVMKPVVVVIFIFMWLVEIWGIFIVRSYGKQLQDEEAARPLKLGGDYS